MNILILGMPGSGKSTQGRKLGEFLSYPYISAGQLLREISNTNTEEALEIKKIQESGELVSDNIIFSVLTNELKKDKYEKGFILDGFPRSLSQAKLINFPVDIVFYLKITDQEALWRLAHRRDKRADDTLETMLKRIDLFHKLTDPLIKYLQEKYKVIVIDASGSIEETFEKLKEAFLQKK